VAGAVGLTGGLVEADGVAEGVVGCPDDAEETFNTLGTEAEYDTLAAVNVTLSVVPTATEVATTASKWTVASNVFKLQEMSP
jgi:hypothetical protein